VEVRGCVLASCGSAVAGSWPLLSADQSAWQPFNGAIATPNAGKRMAVRFMPADGADFSWRPLSTGPMTAVRLHIGTDILTCTEQAGVPPLEQGQSPGCFFHIEPGLGDVVRLEYQGLFPEGEDLRWEIVGLAVQNAALNSFAAFDSAAPVDPFAGTPIAVPAPQAGAARLPARLVVVLDKSGSMDWSARPDDPACGSYGSPAPQCRRWDILRTAAAQMAAVAKAYRLPGDQLGLVLFDSSATVEGGGLTTMDSATLDAITTILNDPGNQPGGSTSIGAGVTALQAALEADNADYNNMILVFTDGEQNTPPYLQASATSLLINPTDPVDLGSPFPSAGNGWRTCVFRLRTDDPAAPDMTIVNQRIADLGCTLVDVGDAPINAPATLDTTATELVIYFLGILQATLIGDKLELVAQSTGAIPPDQEGPVEIGFPGALQDLAVTVLIDWEIGRRAPRRATLAKDGVSFDLLFLAKAGGGLGANHLAATLRPPLCAPDQGCTDPGGDWTLAIEGDRSDVGPWHYGAFVLADNASLGSAFRVAQPQPGVGAPLHLEATLGEAGTPVTGLPEGAVRASVAGPGVGLGNVLSAADVDQGQIDTPDPLTPAALKVLGMRGNPELAAELEQALGLGPSEPVTLIETAPGVYAADFASTGAEGVYRVRFEVDGETPANGPYQRVWVTDHYVQVVPSPEATGFEAVTIPCDLAGSCFRLTLTPRDAAGNLLGPGKTKVIAVGDFSGRVLDGGVSDNLDGTYALSVGYEAGERTPPVVDIQGTGIALPPVEDWAGGGLVPPTDKDWRWWLVLILLSLTLVVLLLWLLRGRAGP
jgi:hypothetical protein